MLQCTVAEQHKDGDSAYPFYQFYDQANSNYEAFVQIR